MRSRRPSLSGPDGPDSGSGVGGFPPCNLPSDILGGVCPVRQRDEGFILRRITGEASQRRLSAEVWSCLFVQVRLLVLPNNAALLEH